MVNRLLFSRLLLLSLLLSLPLQASEVDSFTHRHSLRDSAPLLNQVVNVWMEEAVIEANKPTLLADISRQKESGCDEKRLLKTLENRFAAYLIGQLETFANESTALDTIRVPFADSIYQDLDFTESPTVSLTERLAVSLRVGDVMLGADKLGHFFTEGYAYFERYQQEGEQSALLYGNLSESTFYGELSTGIFSFADLAANLNGLRFWNAILAKQADPLQRTVTPQPYIACRNDKWQRVRTFDWLDYVDPAWDEAINCNAYRDDQLLHKVQKRIVLASDGKQCPLVNIDQAALAKKYGRLLPAIYNDQGPRVLQSFNRALQQYWNEIIRKLELSAISIDLYE